jgi:ABC-type antimicrobial peptide transport system permease subunit
VNDLREAVQAVTSDIPLARVMTMHEIAADSTARTTFTLIILAVAAIVALILGMVGIYGVASYAVSFRTREIGIRMALGADVSHVRGLVLRQGLTLAVAGIVTGLVVSLGLTRLMEGLLYGVRPTDPISLVVVTILLLTTAAAANLVPARRAARINPSQILNND